MLRVKTAKSFILLMVIVNFSSMKRLSFLCIVSAFLFFGPSLFCQEMNLSGMKAQLDTMFENLDKSKVPTGFLWDMAVNLIERDGYNGSSLTDSNYVSLPVMCDMLYSINSACVTTDTLFAHDAIKRLKRNSSSTHQMVGVLFQPYNYIVDNALADNLIGYSNDRVYDSYINGVWQNPYAEDVLFGHVLGFRGSVSPNTTFTITNIDTLSTLSFQSILFDPGDGSGYRSVSVGDLVYANYPQSGWYETKLMISVSGLSYQSHGLVHVESSVNGNGGHHCPHKKDSLPSVDFHDVYATFEGVDYSARVTYAPSLGFDDPLIVAEGFDPWPLMKEHDKKVHLFSGFTDYYDVACDSCAHSSFSGKAVFYIDWHDPGADIRANAKLLKEVIIWVNNNKISGNKNIVMGQSMGGLIARYALKDMERHEELHDTELFISHDSPHLGANVSPGLLYLYRDAMSLTNSLFTDAVSILFDSYDDLTELRRLGNYQSVKQMLPLYLDYSQSFNSTQYDELQNSPSMQGLPQGDPGSPIENVAIVNGGYLDLTDSYINGNKLFFAQLKLSLTSFAVFYPLLVSFSKQRFSLADWLIPGLYTFDFDWSVYPYTLNNALIYNISLEAKKRFSWKTPKTYSLFSKTHLSPTYGIPYDNISSSYYYVDDDGSISNISLGNLAGLNIKYAKRIPFIPTASALMMSGSNAFYRDCYSNKPNPITETPFSAYILNQNGSNHISFFSGISSWLQQLSQAQIDGPNIAFTGDSFSILPGYLASSYSFYTSNSSASINSSGDITITKSGEYAPDLVDIIAKKENTNSVISKRKRVLAGFPKMKISSSHSGNTYSVSSVCAQDEVSDFLSNTGFTDSLMRKWELEIGGQVVAKDSSYTNFASFVVPDSVRLAYVTLKLKYKGRTSEPVTAVIKEKRDYSWNIVDIIRYEDHTVYLRGGRLWWTDNDNPPYFKLKKNPSEPGVVWPARLKATVGDTVIRTTGDLTIIDDCVVWDLFTEPAVLSLINLAYRTDQVKQLIIEVYSDTEETDATLVQTIVIPIHPVVPPIPLEM